MPGKSRLENSAWASESALSCASPNAAFGRYFVFLALGDRTAANLLPEQDALRSIGLSGARQNHGYIIRLLGIADPIRHGACNDLADARERLVVMLLDQRHQSFLSELA